jgi:hypothetical protein
MEKSYWIARKRAAIARRAAAAEAQLIHQELAGRYSLKAAYCLPFLIVKKGPATDGERAALRLPGPGDLPPSAIRRPPPGPSGRDGEWR